MAALASNSRPGHRAVHDEHHWLAGAFYKVNGRANCTKIMGAWAGRNHHQVCKFYHGLNVVGDGRGAIITRLMPMRSISASWERRLASSPRTKSGVSAVRAFHQAVRLP
jgi:hypothetical protein